MAFLSYDSRLEGIFDFRLRPSYVSQITAPDRRRAGEVKPAGEIKPTGEVKPTDKVKPAEKVKPIDNTINTYEDRYNNGSASATVSAHNNDTAYEQYSGTASVFGLHNGSITGDNNSGTASLFSLTSATRSLDRCDALFQDRFIVDERKISLLVSLLTR